MSDFHIAQRQRDNLSVIELKGYLDAHTAPRLEETLQGLLNTSRYNIVVTFRASERATRRWLGSQMDVDAELLEIVESGSVGTSRIGHYTREMQRQFNPEMVVDMLCYMRIHLELAIAAKGLLMMREAGFKPPVPEGTREKFAELKHLEKHIGITGLLAIKPLLHMTTRDIWQIYQLDS